MALFVHVDGLLERHGDRPARLFTSGLGFRRSAGLFDIDLRGQRARAEETDAVFPRARNAGLLKDLLCDLLRSVDLLLVDRLLQPVEIHFAERIGENVFEAALRQTHIERHLAAFEAIDLRALARLGAFDTAAGRLAKAG